MFTRLSAMPLAALLLLLLQPGHAAAAGKVVQRNGHLRTTVMHLAANIHPAAR